MYLYTYTNTIEKYRWSHANRMASKWRLAPAVLSPRCPSADPWIFSGSPVLLWHCIWFLSKVRRSSCFRRSVPASHFWLASGSSCCHYFMLSHHTALSKPRYAERQVPTQEPPEKLSLYSLKWWGVENFWIRIPEDRSRTLCTTLIRWNLCVILKPLNLPKLLFFSSGKWQQLWCNREEQIWLHIGPISFTLTFVFYCFCYKLITKEMLPISLNAHLWEPCLPCLSFKLKYLCLSSKETSWLSPLVNGYRKEEINTSPSESSWNQEIFATT